MKEFRFRVYAALWVSRETRQALTRVLTDNCGIQEESICSDFHLTVYFSNWSLPGVNSRYETVEICADIAETRFMLCVPGGENKKEGVKPNEHSVGIRLTKRNSAINDIQKLRASLYKLETGEIVGNGTSTTAWKNSIHPLNFQPHIKLLQPGSNIDKDLYEVGQKFRSCGNDLVFDRFQVISSC